MTETIYKFPLQIVDGPQDVSMPDGAVILHTGLDPQGSVCVWAQVDPEQPNVTRRFQIIGTGHPTNLSWREHVGSVLQSPFVWHVYEVES